MFVQEFVRIERPLTDAVSVFEHTVLPRLADLVREAWERDGTSGAPAHVPIAVGLRRDRTDGVAYAVSWQSTDAGFPAFNADFELATVNPTETHLEFAGQSRFPHVPPWSTEERRVNRESMAAVDRLLRSIALIIEACVNSAP